MLPWSDWRTIRYNFGSDKYPDYVFRRIAPARAFAWSTCTSAGESWYARASVNPLTRQVGPLDKLLKSTLVKMLKDPTIPKVGHNVRYDLLPAEKAGMVVRGPVFDTMIFAHVATSGKELTYALKPLAKKYLDIAETDQRELIAAVNAARREAKKLYWSFATQEIGGKKPAMADYWFPSVAQLCETYAVEDAVRTQMLFQMFWDTVRNDERMWALVLREHQLLWTLKRMEDRGTRVFPAAVRRLKKFYTSYIQKWEKVVIEEAGAPVNPRGDTIKKLFYESRGHPPRYTDKGNYRLNGSDLLELATGYLAGRGPRGSVRHEPDQLARATLEITAADQTISSFLDVYERYWVRDSTGIWVLHPNYRQTGTVTGRLSCSDPNLMQVASETTGRRKADIQSRPREAFGPRPGCYWYLPDYSQIEVWLFAFLSGEERMQAALLGGHDFHGTIAKTVFGNRSDFELHKDYYRKCAKLIMFAKLYGGGVNKIAALMKTDYDTAATFVSRYEAEMPGINVFMRRLINRAIREGEILNPYGRRYELEKDFAYRAVNYLIQGTAADVMKNAMIYVDRVTEKKWNNEPRLLLTIHDELAVEVPEECHSLELMGDIREAMQLDSHTVLHLPVPLPVEMKIVVPGARWNRTKKIPKPLFLAA